MASADANLTPGTDLYVGWTMWRSRSTILMIGHMFRDLFQNPLAADIRSASGRALRSPG